MPTTLIEAVQAVQAASADEAPEVGTILERVNCFLAAVDTLEATLRETFSERELERLMNVLKDMLADPFDSKAEFWEIE